MSDFSLTLVLQIKTSKIINDMAKVQQKSEKISAFGGIFFVLDRFDRILSSVIDSHLGLRSKLIGYQYSEIIRAVIDEGAVGVDGVFLYHSCWNHIASYCDRMRTPVISRLCTRCQLQEVVIPILAVWRIVVAVSIFSGIGYVVSVNIVISNAWYWSPLIYWLQLAVIVCFYFYWCISLVSHLTGH